MRRPSRPYRPRRPGIGGRSSIISLVRMMRRADTAWSANPIWKPSSGFSICSTVLRNTSTVGQRHSCLVASGRSSRRRHAVAAEKAGIPAATALRWEPCCTKEALPRTTEHERSAQARWVDHRRSQFRVKHSNHSTALPESQSAHTFRNVFAAAALPSSMIPASSFVMPRTRFTRGWASGVKATNFL